MYREEVQAVAAERPSALASRYAGKTVLAIGAHPDDLEIGIGGTLARLHGAGAKVIMAIVSVPSEFGASQDEYLGDLKMQAQEYGQKLQDAAVKARDYASEKFARAGDKFNELKDKDPRQLVEDAKQYAREKPGHALLISAAAGLVLGLLLKRRR